VKNPPPPKLSDAERRRLCADVAFLDVLAADGVDVKRNGNHWLCKLRDERTPSCHVYPPGVGRRGADGWTLHDHGDGWGGDALAYMMDKRGLSWWDAVADLARRTGFTPECMQGRDVNAGTATDAKPKPEPPAPAEPAGPPSMTLDEQAEAAAIFLRAVADHCPNTHTEAAAFLDMRACLATWPEPRAFVLNADQCNALVPVLANGPKVDLLLRAGLLKPPADGKPMRLAWWDRVLLLACADPTGRPAYFVARRVDWRAGDRAGKYINQPCTAGAVRLPFGLPELYQAAGKEVLLVEGPLDAMAAGVLGRAAVALLTRPQAHGYQDRHGAIVKMLDPHLQALRAARLVRVVPDNDAGDKGAEGQALAARLVGWLRAAGCHATLSTLPELYPDAPADCKDLADIAAAKANPATL